ncbi:hypothetical protein BpHYR1_048674 [Brachionus plicatilis]|uniref:Uncharacterized protein n=2 Tax=Brachionus plicatilis TaxID=10195 RepID=A0A3M7QMW2_BRAPC|nr:hypothetical protein BpHYR1_048674 [Brachionus plicatilis]
MPQGVSRIADALRVIHHAAVLNYYYYYTLLESSM